MKRILILGAGKSATALIDYLVDQAQHHDWQVVVADRNKKLAEDKVEGRANASALELDILDADGRAKEIEDADFVISLLPPFLHIHAARDCVRLKTNLATASYVSKEINELNESAKDAGVLLMNEMGADPGIDHMSAMQLIDQIREDDGVVTSFQSYCGGLIAPESDTNPWHYKIAWNPWNIVRAGSGGADFIMNDKTFHRTYEQLYKKCSVVEVEGYGEYAAYANRDSLKYKESYALENAHTILRATLRHPDFVKGWAAVVALGLTSDTKKMDVSGLTVKEWFTEASSSTAGYTLSEKLKTIQAEPIAYELLQFLDFSTDEKLTVHGEQVHGKVLQSILEKKWELKPEDKDILVFQHDIEYEQDGDSKQIISSLVVKGENQTDTAMAKCVGLPMAIFAKLWLTGKISDLSGVQIPTMKKVYQPVLEELATAGIEFVEN